MAQIRDNLPVKSGYLKRRRIEALLEQAIQNPLITVVAGSGYGKTYAVASFVQNHPIRLIWLHLSPLDNVPQRFWRSFTRACREDLPALAQQFKDLDFPNTLAKIDTCLSYLSEDIGTNGPILLVVDDYEKLTQPDVQHFFADLLVAGLDDLRMIFISRATVDLTIIGLSNSIYAFQITAQELRFTPAETRQLFAGYGINITLPWLNQIDVEGEGWPLALNLFAKQFSSAQQGYFPSAPISLLQANQLFEQEFFSPYSRDLQLLLVKLSFLHGFSFDLVKKLGTVNLAENTDNLKNHMFIAYNLSTHLYTFHTMYRAFLTQKRALLTPEEIQQTYTIAGAHFLAQDQLLEAIDCFEKTQNYELLLTTISLLANARMGITKEQANFSLYHLDRLPPAFLADHPLAEFLKATIHINNLEIAKAEQLLRQLETRLLPQENPIAHAILGEVYTFLGAIQMIRNQEDFGYYYQKACTYLPEGTNVKKKNMLLTENNNHLSIQDNRPGALARMEKAVHMGGPYMAKAMNGGGHGIEQLFSTEAAYHTFDFSAAEKYAYQAIYKALEKDQHDTLCNAHLILAKVAFMNGNYEALTQRVKLIQDYINTRKIVALFDLRDTVLGWFYLRMDEANRMPHWVRNVGTDDHNQPPITMGRDRTLYARYLIHIKAYKELLPFLDELENILFLRGSWVDRLYIRIFRAVAYTELGMEKTGQDALWQAYDMSHQNHIITPFVESAGYMRKLIEVARERQVHPFAEEWLESIYQKSSAYAKKQAALVKIHNRLHSPAAPRPHNLSKREIEVLRCLSQGLTREEIAETYSVSINTVKTYIKNIYDKLGAVNRADAVRTATTRNLI